MPELELELPKTQSYLREALTGLACKVFSPMTSALCAFFDFGADSAIADALNAESCQEMEIAVLIGADGNLKELYFSLPMRMSTEQSGIRFSTDGHLSMTLTVDTPKSVSISAPSGGSSYSAIELRPQKPEWRRGRDSNPRYPCGYA